MLNTTLPAAIGHVRPGPLGKHAHVDFIAVHFRLAVLARSSAGGCYAKILRDRATFHSTGRLNYPRSRHRHAEAGARPLRQAGDWPRNDNEGARNGSPGPGSLGHLLIEQFKRKAGIDIQHVPAPNSGVTDVLAIDISMTLTAMMTVGEQVQAGHLIALAVTSTERNPVFKGIPTFAEQGYPDVRGATWFWLCGPKDLPPDVVAKLSEATRRIVKSPKIEAHFQKQALLSKDLDAAAVQKLIAEEYAFWAPLAKAAGLKVQ